MGNLSNQVNQVVFFVEKDKINEKTLIPIFNVDSDFTENTDYFREYTLSLGFDTESERVSKEIYEKHKDKKGLELITNMVKDVFTIPNFIGTSDQYGDYSWSVEEVKTGYIIGVAFIY